MNHIKVGGKMRKICLMVLLLSLVPAFVFSEDVDESIYQAVSQLTKNVEEITLAVGEITPKNNQVNQGLPEYLKDRFINSAGGRGKNWAIVAKYTVSDISDFLKGSGGNTKVGALIEGSIYPQEDGSVEVLLNLRYPKTDIVTDSADPFIISAEDLKNKGFSSEKIIPKTFFIQSNDAAAKQVISQVENLMKSCDFKESGDPAYLVDIELDFSPQENAKRIYLYPKVYIKIISISDGVTECSYKNDDLGRTDDILFNKDVAYNKAYARIKDDLVINFTNELESVFGAKQ